MDLINLDKEKCIQCGLCASVCSLGVLQMDNYGPKVVQQTCNTCGHCVAVCPKEALDHVHAPLAQQIPLEEIALLDARTAAHFLRSRRSIRNFQQKKVAREKISQLLDITRFAPAGFNNQGITYHVIDDPETLQSITDAFMIWSEEVAKQPTPWSGILSARANAYRKTGRDGLLWSAPCLIIALTSKNFFEQGKANTYFSLGYAQLYAPSLGLGSCWIGGIEACVNAGYDPLIRLLNLPENISITGALAVGYPQYQYKRLVDRGPLQLTWANKGGIN